jgi:hypothetical protein
MLYEQYVRSHCALVSDIILTNLLAFEIFDLAVELNGLITLQCTNYVGALYRRNTWQQSIRAV